jgi:AcrR family transcriptional regulator
MRVRTEARRCDILDAAAGVFLEQGFERASMSEIAARIGGSKTTLYGYFRSKEELFVAVVLAEAHKQVAPAFEQLDETMADLRDALVPAGEKLIAFIISPDAVAAHRMVMSEADRSDIGQHFYVHGRQRALDLLVNFFERANKLGKIRDCDFLIAATHFLGLIESELLLPAQFRIGRPAPTRLEIRRAAERAVDVFLAAYGPGPRLTPQRAFPRRTRAGACAGAARPHPE